MKRSTKIISIVIVFFLIIASVITARTMIGNHFQKKFGKRPPPGIIVTEVVKKEFSEKIETFGTAVSNKTKSFRIKKEDLIGDLNLNNYEAWSLDIFEGLENLSLIALDNIHAIAGDLRWEEALFDLLNRVIETKQTMVLCSSHLGPSNPAFVLPDLRSRLAWGVIYHVNQLDDNGREEAVRLRAAERGLKLSNQALQFLLHHSERDLKSLMSLLARLDTRSLQEQKRLSVGMVKRELNLN